MPGTFALPAGPASPAAARARPQPPPRACRTPRPRQCQVRRACREAGRPPGVAELNCSGLGGPGGGVPDRVRNTKLTYPIPPRISPRHAAPAGGRPASRPPGRPAGGWRQGPQAARPLAAGSTGGRQRYRMFHLAYPTRVLRQAPNLAERRFTCVARPIRQRRSVASGRRHCAALAGGGHLLRRPPGDRWFCPTVVLCRPRNGPPPRTP